MARLKLGTTISSIEELGEVLGEYATCVIERDAIKVELEKKIAELREAVRPQTESLDATEKALLSDMAAFCQEHPEIFPDGTKSVELAHGTIGFRTGMPKVTLKRGMSEDDLVQRLLEDGVERWVRQVPALDKQKILADYAEGGPVAREIANFVIKVKHK